MPAPWGLLQSKKVNFFTHPYEGWRRENVGQKKRWESESLLSLFLGPGLALSLEEHIPFDFPKVMVYDLLVL